MKRSDAAWRKILNPARYHILRQKGTEPPFSGKLLHNKEKGIYTCAACGAVLFDSKTKFDSGTGWPSFYEAANKDALEFMRDDSHGMERTEVICAQCKSHLGHVFDDGPQPTGKRYCINSLALDFKKDEHDERPENPEKAVQ